MKRSARLYFLLVVFIASKSIAQDTLPNFTIVERGDKVTISWVNPFSNVVQLNVQRSFDSSRFFTTVFSALTPGLPQNGFTEAKMPTNKIYYRIFYVLDGGSYFFTPSKRVGTPSVYTPSQNRVSNIGTISAEDRRIITVRVKDTAYRRLPANVFHVFRDSILRQTKDTLLGINDTTVLLKPFVARELWRPSLYVYTNRDGFINISIPLYRERRYRIRFFEEDGRHLFDIRHVRESPIILDKANFIHAGWFTFELYEDDKLKEKNKFFVPRDF